MQKENSAAMSMSEAYMQRTAECTIMHRKQKDIMSQSGNITSDKCKHKDKT